MEREAFLDHIAAKLGRARLTEAPKRTYPGVPDSYKANPFGAETLTQADWAGRFETELEALGGRVFLVETLDDLKASMTGLFAQLGTKTIVTWDRTAFVGLNVDWLWDERHAIAWSIAAADMPLDGVATRLPMTTPDVGITTADFAIANTGTLVLCTRPERSRSVSLLPSMHIAILRESQIRATMGEVLPEFGAWTPDQIPSSVHFISGPSRSSDIENDLTIGVHGPVAVTVFLCKGI